MRKICPISEELGQVSVIESSKVFQRLAEKTQVRFPTLGEGEVFRNRLTHSYEVATSTQSIALSISKKSKNIRMLYHDIDYMGSLRAAALAHDLGVPPLGHDGSRLLSKMFKAEGLPEPFSENDQVLAVIEKNLVVSNHTKASTIKYPEKMPEHLAKVYHPLLSQEILRDAEHFELFGIHLSDAKRTIACQLMDDGDRNTYITSDLKDFLSLGNSIPSRIVYEMAEEQGLYYRFSELPGFIRMLESRDKSHIESYFKNMRQRFNENYSLTSSGLTVENEDLLNWREFLWDLEFQFYITPLRTDEHHLERMNLLSVMVNRVLKEDFCPSRYYAEQIRKSTTHEDVLRAKLKMLAEMTDWYITNHQKIVMINAGTTLINDRHSTTQRVLSPDSPLIATKEVADVIRETYGNDTQ